MPGVLLDKFVAVDIETTGSHPADDRIIELAAVRFEAGREVAARSWLTDPRRPIPLRFQQLTGIGQDMVSGQPPAEQVLPEFLELVAGAPIAAHNAGFDAGFIAAACRRAALQPPSPVLDSLEFARLAFPRSRSYRLASLARELGLELPRTHRAEDDARACGLLLVRSLQRIENLELGILLEALRLAPYDWPLRPLLEAAAHAQEAAGVRARPAAAWIAPSERPLHVGEDEAFTAFPERVDPDEAAAVLGRGGPVAAAHPAYELRPQQVQMTRLVAEAMNGGRHLLVEAGTGTGKSLAYLVPALMWARLNNEKVVISTHTITLQEQLWQKDIPFLLQAMGWDDVEAALVKGRSNYVCLRKWEEKVAGADFGTSIDDRLLAINSLAWIGETTSGDRGEWQPPGGGNGRSGADEFWTDIQSESETCLGPKCRWYGRHCYAFRARQRAKDARILIVNHALLFSDLKMGGGILPRYQTLIIDEAHHLEAVATEHLGISIGTRDLLVSLLRLFRGFRSSGTPGILPQIKRKLDRPLPASPPVGLPHEDLLDRLMDLVFQARDAAGALGSAVAALVESMTGTGDEESRSMRLVPAVRDSHLWGAADEARAAAVAVLKRLAEGLANLGAALEDLDERERREFEGMAVEISKQAGLLYGAAGDIDAVLLGSDEDMVYWVEASPVRSGGDPRITLRAAPIHVGDLLRESLFEKLRSVTMTSATLTVSGQFDHIARRLGLAELPREQVMQGAVASPFRYQDQALVLIPDDVPNPRAGSEADFTGAVRDFLGDFLVRVGGRTLVLFTSHRQLRQVYTALKPGLEEQGLLLLGQGVDGQRSRLVEEFRTGERAVLFGSASFWEGVDIPGDGLSCVVMVRLPFAPPDDPVTAARIEHLERRGLSSFFHLSLPQAVIRFKQGFGRLIRTATDRGVVVVFDNRVHPGQTRYGTRFIQSLPRPRLQAAPRAEVIRLAVEFLDQAR